MLRQRVVEVARRMAGSQLTHGQAAEAIAAGGLPARSPRGEAWPAAEAPRAPPDADEIGPSSRSSTGARRGGLSPTTSRASTADVEALCPFALDVRMRAVLRARHCIG